MSSYGGSGAWDGGPPGAETEWRHEGLAPGLPAHGPPAHGPPAHGPPAHGPPAHGAPGQAGTPSTDPWTGAAYPSYGYPNYGYGYDASYYQQQQDPSYYNKYPNTSQNYPPAPHSYNYPPQHPNTSHSPLDSRSYDRRRRSYSKSVSPYEKNDRGYSRKRDGSYDSRRSRSRSLKAKRKYSSSDLSASKSRSRSRSYSSYLKKDRKRSPSRHSSASDRYYKKISRSRDRSLTPPMKSKHSSRSRSHRTPSPKQPTSKAKRDEGKLNKDKKQRVVTTPPKKVRAKSPKVYKKSDRSDSPPKDKHDLSGASSKSSKYKDKARVKKPRDSSLTPPKSYARHRSSSRSKSRSRSSTPPPAKHRRSITSHSSSRSSSRDSRSKRRVKKSRSRNRSHSRRRSASTNRTKSRRRSISKGKKRSNSKSRSRSKSRSSRSRSRSRSDRSTDDERRGQFTVADRKRFWRMQRTIQEKTKEKTPPVELKPPPGAMENARAENIEYGDPPEIEGLNFAELLPSADQVLQQASSSKNKNIPIPIKNDGSFLEMFKKLQEVTKKEEGEKKPEIKKPLPFIGKRRGGRVLKTGVVKKAKAIDEQTVDNTPKDAWSLYMQEVKKYRETSCEEERKTRPLVK